ncbi:MAG TPA: CRISPR system precrRNA processing endoribonuclease RAMP protein Cas6 [Thermoanaerobaculia bacterium]
MPEFQGSMLRGAFGHALRRLACSMGPAQLCATCPLRRVCAYPRLFEPVRAAEPAPSFLRGIDEVARPYVFEPRSDGGRLAPGEPLGFDLLLFGQTVELQAYAILAVQRMALAGLGTRRSRFRLARVEAIDPAAPPLLLVEDGVSLDVPPAPPVVPRWEPLSGSAATLRFLTPLRLKVHDHLTDRPRFRDLAFAILRRTLELAHTHVPSAALDWDIRPLLDQTQEVRVTATDLVWQDQKRWSQRQKTSMRLGGVVGTMTLEGDLSPFAALLRTAEVVHLGKGATFGLGQIGVVLP